MVFYQVLLIFVCYIGHVTGAYCPSGWVASDTSCYLFVAGHPSSFTEAEHYCQQHQSSHLVEVETDAENLFLRDFMRRLKGENHWLGLTDERTEGIWRWYSSDTIPSYTGWHAGQPGSNAGDEDCAAFWKTADYQWDDVSCMAAINPVCEISQATEPEVIG